MDLLTLAIGASIGSIFGLLLAALCVAWARADNTSPPEVTAAATPSGPPGPVDGGSGSLPDAPSGGEDTSPGPADSLAGGAPGPGGGSYDGAAAMCAVLVAGSRIRGGYYGWLRGAPTHVLAELLTELRTDGWELRRATPSRGPAGEAMRAVAP